MTYDSDELHDLVEAYEQTAQQLVALGQRALELAGKIKRAAGGNARTTKCPYDAILAEWNERCAKRGMVRRNKIGVLQPKVLRVWKRYPNLDLWKAAFDACARNDFWRGERGWRGNLESFVRPQHYDKFFDVALVDSDEAAPPGKEDAPFQTVEQRIDELLANPALPLPGDYEGKDPREVRGKDDAEFARRLRALREHLESDWRFDL